MEGEMKMAIRRNKRAEYEQWLQSAVGEREVNRKSLNAQTYIDVRALASIDMFLVAKGIRTRTISETLREVINMALVTIEMEGEEIFTSVEEAVDYLTRRGFSMAQFANPSNAQFRRIRTALQAEAYAQDRRRGTASVLEGEYRPKNILWDAQSGMLMNSTIQALLDRGYRWTDAMYGTDLPPGVLEGIKRGQLPPPVNVKDTTQEIRDDTTPQESGPICVKEAAPEDRSETIEEAIQRRTREAKAQRAAMMEALKASREERSKDEDI